MNLLWKLRGGCGKRGCDSGGSFAARMRGEEKYGTNADEPKVMDSHCEVIGRPKVIRVEIYTWE